MTIKSLSRRSLIGAICALGSPIGRPTAAGAAVPEQHTMRLAMPTAADSIFGQAALHLASAVQRRSNGQLKIEVYPNGQLASQQATIDGLVTGVIDLAIEASGFLVPLFPQYAVWDMPFIVRDLATGYRIQDGDIGREMFAQLEPKGIVGLAWGSAGFKELQTTRPIISQDDIKGLRMRIPSGAVYVATYQALGAIPLVIDLSETYTALSQHTVEGIDLNLDGFATGKYYTIVKHIAWLHHFFAVQPVLGSKRKIEALPPGLQKILREEGRAVTPFWRSQLARQIAADVDIFKKNGVAFSEIPYAPLRKAVDPVYTLYGAKIGGELVDRFARAANTR
jgi:TRAP-type transport system periplasmic protein